MKRVGGGEGFGGTGTARPPRHQPPQGSDINRKNNATPAKRTLAAKKDRPNDTNEPSDPRARVATSVPCPRGSESDGGGGDGDAAAKPSRPSSVAAEERA